MLEKRHVIIEGIRLDGGTQMRAALDEAVIAAYAEEMAAGDEFPAVTVYYDGEVHWLADGFHRLMARKAQGYSNIEAEIWEGSRRDAVLYAISANNRHGLRRTTADKRKAVEEMLRDGEWKTWSDRAIARRCGVTAPYVGKIRGELTVNIYSQTGETTGEIPQSNAEMTIPAMQVPDLRKGADGRVINVANIGKKPEPLYVPVWAIELMVRGWVEELEGAGEDGAAALAAVKGLPPTPVVKELLSLAAEKLAGPYRRTEMAQAVNNVIEQRRQGEGPRGLPDSSSQTPRNDSDGVAFRELAAETPAVKVALPKLNATPKTWGPGGSPGAVGLKRDWSAQELEEYAEANEVVGGDDDGEDEPTASQPAVDMPTPVSLDKTLLIGRVVAPPSEREDRIRTYARLRTIYHEASASLRMYEEMTGDFGSRLPMLRLLEPMLAALDRHIGIFEHGEDGAVVTDGEDEQP